MRVCLFRCLSCLTVGGGAPWNSLLGTGLSWAREGLGAPGSAMLGCAGPPGLEAGRQVPAGLHGAQLGCDEAKSRLQSGSSLYLMVLVHPADRLRSASEAQSRLRKGLGLD